MHRRNFIKKMGAATLVAAFATSGCAKSDAKAKILIIGGGAAGITAAARLCNRLASPDITLIDPSDLHYYQPGFTLIASGVYSPDEVYRKQADCIPSGVKWVKDSAVAINPDKREVSTKSSGKFSYDFLVLTPGLVLNWDLIEGIDSNSLGAGDAHCIYTHEGAIKTRQGILKFIKNGGRGIYTDTYTKHKCGGAPKKICLLTEHLSRKEGVRKNIKLDFFTASKQLYDVPYFTPRLLEVYKERDVSISLNTRIKGIDTASKKVHLLRVEKISKTLADGSKQETKKTTPIVEDYDFLHFLPPMCAPKFVSEAGLSVKTGSRVAEGWIAVDKETLVHKEYSNIITFGDASGLPTSKTSAAIRKQAPIAVENLISIMEGRVPEAKYDGYAACPIITDYGHLIMAEFDYNKNEKCSFPFSMMDMSKESRLAWLLKVYGLKPMYFYGMLNGLA